MRVHSMCLEYLSVDTARIGHASTVAPVSAFVNVNATLAVKASVIDTDALNGRASESRRARVATETRY